MPAPHGAAATDMQQPQQQQQVPKLPLHAMSPAKQQQQPGANGSADAAAAADPLRQGKQAAAGSGGGVPASHRASLRGQAAALYRKNATFQRRNACSNVCLLSAPIFFCLMLLAIQVAINRLLLTGEDYECGCQCTRCCFQGNPNNCTSLSTGTCSYDCLERNRSACGLQFSTPRQSIFCAIPHTSAWPPILQAPAEEDRAAPHKPKAAFLYTGANASAAAALSSGLLSPPGLSPPTILAAQRYLEAFGSELGGAATVPGEFLSLLGFRLGTSSPIQAGLYLETALVGDGATLYALYPDGGCQRLGLLGAYNTSLLTMVQTLVRTSNSPAVAAVINGRLSNLTALGGGGQTDAMTGQVLALRMNCTDVVMVREPDADALQRALYCGYHQARCDGASGTQQYAAAFDWRATRRGTFQPHLYYNDTYGLPRNEAPTVYQRVPQVLNMAVNSWLKNTLGPGYSAELVGVMETPKMATKVNLDFSALLGPLFFTWVIQMLLPVFLMQLVYEKERRLRMMMKMHGLGDTAYWIVMYSWFLLLYVLYMAIFVFFGSVIGLNMFRKNSYGIQAVLYFVFGNNMIALAFLLSCFFTSAKTATVFAYLVVFGTGLIGSLLLTQLINAGQWYTTVLQLVPSFALFRGLFEMGEYAFLAVYRSSYGMALPDLWARGNGMLVAWLILAVEWVVFMAAAWYLEQVFASGTGNRRHPLFFLEPLKRLAVRGCGGTPGAAATTSSNSPDDAAAAEAALQQQQQALASPRRGLLHMLKSPRAGGHHELQLPTHNGGSASPLRGGTPSMLDAGLADPASGCVIDSSAVAAAAGKADGAAAVPEDVASEAARVARLADYGSHPIVIRGLNKSYPGLDGQPPKLAVRQLDLGIERGECFGLLGPNGAGKSTSINMLVGLLQPTAGTALVGGHDIRAGMEPIYALMGVCPQHDLLWDTLSGREHLLFYGRLKGLAGEELAAAVESSLRAVNLWNNRVADKQAGAYSGGMKRRLSVAISFMGDPLVVYLDEPSTGLDPASRRNLWDVVKANKPGRSIVLTTHSMEEAEVLCDRLGIFVDGRLVCIGNPKEITSRYGGFLVFTITVPAEQEGAARQLVAGMSPSARLTYSVGGTLKFELPTSEVNLSRVFATMAGSATSGLAILDWGVAHASLEGVFIDLVRKRGGGGA